MANKVLALIMLKRFDEASDEWTRESQCRFLRGRGYTDQVFTLCLCLQRCERYNFPISNMLLDFFSAFDSVTRKNLWQITVEDGMPVKFVKTKLRALQIDCKSAG